MTSVTVLVRARPLSLSEIASEAKVILKMDKYKTYINGHYVKKEDKLKMKRKLKSERFFFFERSYWSVNRNDENFADQKTIYDEYGTKIVESALNGYNACLFAYGQTGSGKTYTMMGDANNKGVIPRICDDLFANLNDEKTTFRVEISYMEIYNEQVRDLLERNVKKLSPKSLKLREHPRDGPFVQGLTVHPVTDYASIESLLEEGNNIRATAATNMNNVSSRSHAIFTIKLSQAKLNDNIPSEITSKVNLVDLAGSERVGSSGSTGTRFKEGAFINKSLVILSLVISALAENSSPVKAYPHRQVFVPYRDSVLTWLLKDSLGGNSRTIMIATVSPADSSYNETLSTLKYASQTRKIINRPVINEDPNVKLIRELRAEIAELQNLLSIYKINNDNCKDKDIMQAKLNENQERVESLTKNWIDKNMEAQKIFKEKSIQLSCKGQQTVLSTVKVHLINMEDDPLNTDIVIYHLNEGETLVGNFDITESNCIDLKYPGIEKKHCSIIVSTNKVSISPVAFHTYLNDIHLTTNCYLRHGDILKFGDQRFRFCNPSEAEQIRINRNSGIFSQDVSPLVMDHYRSTECFKDLNETDAAYLENGKNKKNLTFLRHDNNGQILRNQIRQKTDQQMVSNYKYHRLSFPGKFDNTKMNQTLDKKFNSAEILCSSPVSFFQLDEFSSNSDMSLSTISDNHLNFFDSSRLDQSNDVLKLDQFNLRNSQSIPSLCNFEQVSNVSLNKNHNKETRREVNYEIMNVEEKRILLQNLISKLRNSQAEQIECCYESIHRASINSNLFMTQYNKLEMLQALQKEHLKTASSELFNFKNKILEEKYLKRSSAMCEINNRLLSLLNNDNVAGDDTIRQKITKKNYALKLEIEDYWKKMDLYHDELVVSEIGKINLLNEEQLVKYRKYIKERHDQVAGIQESISKSELIILCLTTEIDECHLTEQKLKQEIERIKTDYLAKFCENEEHFNKLRCSHGVELNILINELSELNEQIEQTNRTNEVIVNVYSNNIHEDEYNKNIVTSTYSENNIESKNKDYILELKNKRDIKKKLIEETNQKIQNSILDCRYMSLQLQDEMYCKVTQNETLLKSKQDKVHAIQKQLDNEQLKLKNFLCNLNILQSNSYIEQALETYYVNQTSKTYNCYVDSLNSSQKIPELTDAQLKESLEKKIEDGFFSLEELLVSIPLKKSQRGCLGSNDKHNLKYQRGMFNKNLQLVFHSANPLTHVNAISKLYMTYGNTKYLLMVTCKEICLLLQIHLKLHLEFIEDYLQKSDLDAIYKNDREKIHDLMNLLDMNDNNLYIKNYKSEENQAISFQNNIKRLENEMRNKIVQMQSSLDLVLIHCNVFENEEKKDIHQAQFYSLCSCTETPDEDLKNVWFSIAECACIESSIVKLQVKIMQDQKNYLTMLRKTEYEKDIAETSNCLKQCHLFQNEANQAAGDLLRDVHFCSVLIDSVGKYGKEKIEEKINTEEKIGEKCYSVGGWKYKCNQDGTVLMRKNPEQPGYLCVMACSIINVKPQIVWDAIRNPLFRKVYDDTVENIHVVEHCSDRLKIIYLCQKIKSLFYSQTQLDCCCAYAERVESNQYVLTYVSVNHSNCPVVKNVHRLNVGPSGWVVKLLVNEIGEESSIVWYLVNVQCGEAVTQHVLNNLYQKIPLSITALRNYLVH
ncbi:kinesin-like protein KIF16B isoform X3 [Hydra vulgaris]|uniref:Kinesin-like protein KIF16B isoform X3 n=1 Tax=Hydra vulgaris TaxID=6087 RepID=A0ABM4CJE1_HYDVU